MRCPGCGAELRLAEAVPPALAGADVVVRCPQARCGRDLVATMATTATTATGDAPLLRLPEAAHESMLARARRRGEKEVRRAKQIALVLGGGTMFASGCFACVHEDGSFGAAIAVMIGVALVTFGVFFAMRVGIRHDARASAALWIATLPRAELALAAPPEGYRR